MIEIGIVGVDSFHAKGFAEILNTGTNNEYWHDDVKVTAVYDDDKQKAIQFQEKYDISHVASSLEDIADKVSAAMITTRLGDRHLHEALPFLQNGKHVWVDKPFCKTLEQGQKLVEMAQQGGVVLAGGSNCKYLPSVQKLKDVCATLRKEKKLLSISFNFPGCIDSEYDGLFFYASHSIEMAMEVTGETIHAVNCREIRGSASVLFDCNAIPVMVNLADCWEYSLQFYTTEGIKSYPFSLDRLHEEGLAAFLGMIKGTYAMQTEESLLLPICVMQAMQQSMENKGACIAIAGV